MQSKSVVSANTTALVYWATTLLAALLFAGPGAALVAGAAHFSSDMAHLGFPAYFLPFQGVWKILGAIAILAPGLPRLKEWAYAGMMFDISGAVVARAASGDELYKVALPLAIGLIVAASWALRPDVRRLSGPTL